MIPPILAHGALGWWDEIIFLGVVVIFLIMMGISWVKSRTTQAETVLTEPEPHDPPFDPMEDDDPKRFRLD